MPGYKNQHYVPQVYLRNFSKDGKSIGSCYYNPEEKKFNLSEEAPIKSQACKDYFYTKDPQLEEAFSKLEGEANILVQRILSSNEIKLSIDEEEFLKQYVFFQHFRTPFHANYYETMMNQFYHHIAPEDNNDIKLKDKQLFILKTFMPIIPKMAHPFKLIIIDNQTHIPFITSPEPSIFFNLYQCKHKQNVYGISNHGGMFYMPLSAKKAVFLYDPLAYKIKKKSAISCTQLDAAFLNMQIMEFVRASKTNLFFFDNNTTDIGRVIALMIEFAKYEKYPSFIRDRFYLFGLPKRKSTLLNEQTMLSSHTRVEEFLEFIREHRK